MPIVTRGSAQNYFSPPPWAEQRANATLKGYDPEDVVGMNPYWALPKSRFAAPATCHDEWCLYLLTLAQRLKVDAWFERDCKIIADADGSGAEEFEAVMFRGIILLATPFIDTSIDRNTDITRAQGLARMVVARNWVNISATKTKAWFPPYDLSAFSGEQLFTERYDLITPEQIRLNYLELEK